MRDVQKRRVSARRFDLAFSPARVDGYATTMAEAFILTFNELRRLHGRAWCAQQAGHSEVVGLLATTRRRPRTLRFVFMRNSTDAPGCWKLPTDDMACERQRLRKRGWQTIGLFHSHPLTYAVLGPRDCRSTPTGWVHLVYDVSARERGCIGCARNVSGARSSKFPGCPSIMTRSLPPPKSPKA